MTSIFTLGLSFVPAFVTGCPSTNTFPCAIQLCATLRDNSGLRATVSSSNLCFAPVTGAATRPLVSARAFSLLSFPLALALHRRARSRRPAPAARVPLAASPWHRRHRSLAHARVTAPRARVAARASIARISRVASRVGAPLAVPASRRFAVSASRCPGPTTATDQTLAATAATAHSRTRDDDVDARGER
tara:strand:+ start:2930 stop:3499 length:570 start_codon:yes stop_codon:yes gene_type:complete